ncbi:MAG: hypothetical protein HY544_05115 [Candidatus Diapherotrites archaeon]|uniref:Uncharacterized protein n=1 Tax=Candidatus Iainarchaeum sp. TaxID=3101447 RepID=A0A8T3YPC2_9ARCH|nr:hypothetical protein [Candidatus Diapherotrites archaeon]
MGFLGNILGKGNKGEGEAAEEVAAPQGKYDEQCSLCSKGGTDKKWAGKYFHVKCLRKAKKVAKGMF